MPGVLVILELAECVVEVVLCCVRRPGSDLVDGPGRHQTAARGCAAFDGARSFLDDLIQERVGVLLDVLRRRVLPPELLGHVEALAVETEPAEVSRLPGRPGEGVVLGGLDAAGHLPAVLLEGGVILSAAGHLALVALECGSLLAGRHGPAVLLHAWRLLAAGHLALVPRISWRLLATAGRPLVCLVLRGIRPSVDVVLEVLEVLRGALLVGREKPLALLVGVGDCALPLLCPELLLCRRQICSACTRVHVVGVSGEIGGISA